MPFGRVYGVLGLVNLPIRDGVEVGYQADVSEVYASFIKRPLAEDHELQLLRQVAGPGTRSSPGLPSCCADLRLDAPINQFGGRNGIASGYQAGFKPPSTGQALLLPSSSANTLRLRGWLVDVVVDKVEGHKLSGLMSQHEAANLDAWEDRAFELGKKAIEGTGQEVFLTFNRMLIANRDVDTRGFYVPFEGDDGAKYRAHKEHLRRVIETCKFDSELAPSKFELWDARTDRAFIGTSQGHLGYTRPGVELGDIVCVFQNGVVPFIVRRDVHNNAHVLVGESYISGLMHGEVLDMEQRNDINLVEVSIV